MTRRDGLTLIGQLQDADPGALARRYGATGLWLSRMAHAQDHRPVDPGGPAHHHRLRV